MKASHDAEVTARSEKLQKTLFDSVSHELKTPLAAMSATLEQPQPDHSELRQAVRRLTKTVDHLLDATRLESGDLVARRVTRDQREIKLTATEYALLAFFVRHAGRVLTHRQILREVWGPNSEEHRQYLRVYVTHLRQEIELVPSAPVLIRTEPGIGYRFTAP